MERSARMIYWEAPEHYHIEKTSDWYWVLGIFAIATSVTSIILGNVLFGIVIILGAIVMMLYARRGPRTIAFEISQRGIRIDNEFYPYAILESFYIDEEHPVGPQLIIRQQKLLSQFLIAPIPEAYVDDIEHILSARLPEEHLQEPFAHQLLEFFGF